MGVSIMKENKEVMAANIKHYMELNKVNSSEVCKALGFKQNTFSNWINAKIYPRIDKIELMAFYFGISKSDLVEERVPQQVADNAKPKDTFIEDIQKDPVFIQQIRLLWSLPSDRKSEVYKNIAFQYYEIDMEQREKESSLRA